MINARIEIPRKTPEIVHQRRREPTKSKVVSPVEPPPEPHQAFPLPPTRRWADPDHIGAPQAVAASKAVAFRV